MADDDIEGDNLQTPSFKPGNTNPDGSYKVGKYKPPEDGKFRKGDGRKRGRRAKGTKNLATDFQEELKSKVTLKVDGKPRRVTKQRAIMMRLMDNASRGQNAAIKTIITFAEKLGIELQIAEAQEQENAFTHLQDLTDYELELLMQLTCKATGQEFCDYESDGKLYDASHPLAYLEDPEDSRNFDRDQTIEGVIWKRFRGTRFTDYICGVQSRAYHSAALPRRKPFSQIEENE